MKKSMKYAPKIHKTDDVELLDKHYILEINGLERKFDTKMAMMEYYWQYSRRYDFDSCSMYRIDVYNLKNF